MANKPNYKQIFAIKRQNEERIKQLCPKAIHTSGIYFIHRQEDGFKFGYVGKAQTSLLSRLADHLVGYKTKNPSHIDKSIKKHGLYDELKNPCGYKVSIICYCKPEECNEKERHYIKECANKGWQLRNTENGGLLGKTDINERQPSLGYRDGIKQGEKNMLKKVKVFFEKYLDFVIKDKPNKIKERKYKEFVELLNYEKGVNENEQV